MANVLKAAVAFSRRHPVIRGMMTYGILWPTGCLIQQKIEGKTWDNIDWKTCARFAVYGSLFTAPTLYMWIRISTTIWPHTTFRSAVTKAIVEQMTYGPTALCFFFVGMSLLEGKNFQQAKEEMMAKFWPTFRVGICFWPVFQTFNFALVPERNRVMIVSCGSLMWVVYLAYMKKIEMERLERLEKEKSASSSMQYTYLFKFPLDTYLLINLILMLNVSKSVEILPTKK